MNRIHTDSKQIEHNLKTMLKILSKHDTFIDKSLQIYCLNGNMTLKSSIKKAGLPLISINKELLPKLEDYTLSYNDGNISINHPSRTTYDVFTEDRDELMRLMVENYNLTNKVESYNNISVISENNFDPEIIKHLILARPSEKMLGRKKKSKLDIFLASRQYGGFGDGYNRLLPVIDFADHNVLTSGFDEQKNSLGLVSNDRSVHTNSQLMASYGKNDCLTHLIRYGFVDKSPPYAQSIPFDITLNNTITFEVAAVSVNVGSFRKETLNFNDNNMQLAASLHEFIAEKHIKIAYLLIPNSKWPTYLSNAIAFHLSSYEKKLKLQSGELFNSENIQAIEDKTVESNLAYYKNLGTLATKSKYLSETCKKDVLETCKQQITIIRSFKKALIKLRA